MVNCFEDRSVKVLWLQPLQANCVSMCRNVGGMMHGKVTVPLQTVLRALCLQSLSAMHGSAVTVRLETVLLAIPSLYV